MQSPVGRTLTIVRSEFDTEYAPLDWVDWFNPRHLLEPIGNIPPDEVEKQYYQQTKGSAMVA